MTTKANSKPYQTSAMELFSQVVTNYKGKFRILPTSKMELFVIIVNN